MGKKIAVIYKSKYGTTKKYAGWIALRLDADLYEVSDIREKDIKEYDVIIFGGPLYIGKIKGIGFINKNIEKLMDKKLILFTIGIQSEDEKYKSKILKDNFNEDIIDKINLFYYKGRFNYNELDIIDKLLMKFMKKEIKNKRSVKLSENDKNILKGFNEEVDLTDKKSINSLIEYVNNFTN